MHSFPLARANHGARKSKRKAKQVPKDKKKGTERKGSSLKTPLLRTVILGIGQALLFHHLTQTVTSMITTMNRLLHARGKKWQDCNQHPQSIIPSPISCGKLDLL